MSSKRNPARLSKLCSCCRTRFEDLTAEISQYGLYPFEALRTEERQQTLFEQGFSKTLNSKHLTGHAVDFVPIDRQGRFYWPPPSRAMWDVLRRLARKHRLRNNIPWDRAHVECDHVPDSPPKAGT